MKKLSDRGCKAVIFVEFVPVAEDSRELAPGDNVREYLADEIARLRREHPEMVYISFPGDEKNSDGCVLYEKREQVEALISQTLTMR